jgi:hypothetical protein
MGIMIEVARLLTVTIRNNCKFHIHCQATKVVTLKVCNSQQRGLNQSRTISVTGTEPICRPCRDDVRIANIKNTSKKEKL